MVNADKHAVQFPQFKAALAAATFGDCMKSGRMDQQQDDDDDGGGGGGGSGSGSVDVRRRRQRRPRVGVAVLAVNEIIGE